MVYSIICLCIILLFLYIKTKNLALIGKICASLVFIYLGIFSYLNNPTNFSYFILLFIGLTFSFFGDIFLILKSKSKNKPDPMLFSGLICFVITHIFYSLAFITLGSFNLLVPICTISMFFGFTMFFKSQKNINFRNLIIFCHVYIFTICFMVCNALSLINCNLDKTGLVLVILGALLFMLSDFIITFILFTDDSPKFIGIINLITYYTGQILIALSILYI